eukprot:4516030-Amphidinium_carterae.1
MWHLRLRWGPRWSTCLLQGSGRRRCPSSIDVVPSGPEQLEQRGSRRPILPGATSCRWRRNSSFSGPCRDTHRDILVPLPERAANT